MTTAPTLILESLSDITVRGSRGQVHYTTKGGEAGRFSSTSPISLGDPVVVGGGWWRVSTPVCDFILERKEDARALYQAFLTPDEAPEAGRAKVDSSRLTIAWDLGRREFTVTNPRGVVTFGDAGLKSGLYRSTGGAFWDVWIQESADDPPTIVASFIANRRAAESVLRAFSAPGPHYPSFTLTIDIL